MKRCPRCKRDLPKAEFWRSSKSSDGLQGWCKTCAVAAKRERSQTAEGKRQKAGWSRRSLYGLDPADFDLMVAAQSGVCAICTQPRELHVDHDHETGRIRGLLCSNCNTALGLLGEDVDVLIAALAYLLTGGPGAERAQDNLFDPRSIT